MNKQDYAPDFGALGKTPLPIELGGTFADTAQQALVNLGVAGMYGLDVADGMAKSTPQNFVNPVNIPSKYLYGVMVDGPKLVQFNDTAEFTITNFDSSTKYTVSSTVGNAVLQGDKIYYTAPDNQTVGGFTVNGNYTEVNIGNLVPKTPTILSPVSGATEQNFPLLVTSSAFSLQTNLLTDTHECSDWEASENGTFTKVVASSYNSVINKTSWTLTGLPIGKIYYLRVRHKGTVVGWSEWSNTTVIITKTTSPISFAYQLLSPKPNWYEGAGSEINSNFGNTATLYGEAGLYAGGQAVSLSGNADYCLVGAAAADVNDKGAAFVFKRTASDWVLEAALRPSDAEPEARFGHSTCMSMDGNMCLVGSYTKDNLDRTISNVGSVYVFVKENGTWVQKQKIVPASATDTAFGYSISLSDNGQVLAIGVPYADTYAADTGAMFIYELVNGVFEFKTSLYEQSGGTYGGYGMSPAAFNATGTICAVGHKHSETNYGAVHIYLKDDFGNWSLRQKIKPTPFISGNEYFGNSIGMSADGDSLVIGCEYYDTYTGDGGAAFIYTRTNGVWEKTDTLVPGIIQSSARFGAKVQMSANGKVCAVGCPFVGFNAYYANTGAAFIYVKDASGTWYEANRVRPTPVASNQYFGNDLSLSKDGSVCAVGFISSNFDLVGKVNIYDNVDRAAYPSSGPINQVGAFLAPYTAAVSGDDYTQWFGWAVAMSPDGNTCAVTSPYASVYGVTAYSGLVAIYVKAGGSWSRQAVLKTSVPRSGTQIGSSVALSYDGDVCVVGAKNENGTRGVVYIFKRTGVTWSETTSLTAPITAAYDPYLFGASVAITHDGLTCLIGAPGLNTTQMNGVNGSWSGVGGVYIYTNNSGTWTYKEVLLPVDTVYNIPRAGTSVACTPDASVIVSGAPGVDWNYQSNVVSEGGAVYVYTKAGSTWQHSARLMPSRAQSAGTSVAISDDGARVAVGSPDDMGNTTVTGAVYIFEKDSSGAWVQTANLFGFDTDKGYNTYKLGVSVALSGDGMILLAGSNYANKNPAGRDLNQGAFFTYAKDGNVWNLRKVTYNPTDEANAAFGTSVSISNDGACCAVGAPYEDVGPLGDAGAVYFYA